MLKKIIDRLIRPRHYWRDIGFDELSELYTSMMFRSLAMSLVGIFVPAYLYSLGFPVWNILLFYCAVFSFDGLAAFPIAKIIAKFGPKHTVLLSYILQSLSMLMFATLSHMHWPLLLIALTYGASNCAFYMGFNVDYSKVKHSEHGGKEIGWVYFMTRLGAFLGPIFGGLVAYFIGPQYIFFVAVIMLFVGIIPLMSTREPVRLNQKLNFRGLKVSQIKHDLISINSYQIDTSTTLIIWPIFVGIYIFSEDPYLKLGSITSMAVLLSFFVARAIGKTIDRHRGRQLLHLGAYLNAVVRLIQPFTMSYAGALSINLFYEVIAPMVRMPYTKGLYDAADDLPGLRIVYFTAIEAAGAIGRALLFMVAGVAAYWMDDSKSVFIGIFVVAALASVNITSERFKALDPKV